MRPWAIATAEIAYGLPERRAAASPRSAERLAGHGVEGSDGCPGKPRRHREEPPDAAPLSDLGGLFEHGPDALARR